MISIFFLGLLIWFVFVDILAGDDIRAQLREWRTLRAGQRPCDECGRESTMHGTNFDICQSCYERYW